MTRNLSPGQVWWCARRALFAVVWRVVPAGTHVNLIPREGGTIVVAQWSHHAPAGYSLHYEPPTSVMLSEQDDLGFDLVGWYIAPNGRAHWFKAGALTSACGSLQWTDARRVPFDASENWPCGTCMKRANKEVRTP